MGTAAHAMGPFPDPARDSHGELRAQLGRVAAGDEKALARVYDETSGRVFSLALQILRDRGLAEDATIEVFDQVWRQAGRYEPSRGTPIGWILTLARTRAIDLLRGRSRLSSREETLAAALSLADPAPGPDSSTDAAQRADRLRGALRLLPREQREALLAAYFTGLSHSEVAQALGTPLGTVKTRIRSGLLQLRLLLEETGGTRS